MKSGDFMKMKKSLIALTTSVLSLSIFGAAILVKRVSDVYTPTFATYENGDADTYYDDIDDSLEGNDLLVALRTLNVKRRKSTVGYKQMGTTPSGQFKYTDYDPNYVQYDSNGQPYGTRISSFYTYTSATSWNREHVWPNSHGGGSGGDAGSPYPDADIHMPRPTISSENSSRGNSFFVEGMNHSSNGWDPYTAGYSKESRGEAARITFYCPLVNSRLILAPNNTTPSGKDPVTGQSYGSGHTMGNLETMLKWTIDHAVTQREKNRNEGAEYLQGNRNPFVDHPEYACKIWGNVNATTKSLCDNAQWDDKPYVKLDKTTATVVEEQTTTLTATSSDSSAITWTSSNSSVATVSASSSSSGAAVTIAGVSIGTATITAKATIEDVEYSKSCTVTVTAKPVPAKVTSISIVNEPNKRQYVVGEQLDLTGLKVNAIYDKGEPVDVTSSVTASPTTLNNVGTQKITLTYTCSDGTFNDDFDVTVKESGEEIIPVVESISITEKPTKLEYEVGDELDLFGLEVLATLDDGTTKDVTEDVVADVDVFEQAGEQEVTLTYTCSDGSFSDSYFVEVTDKEDPPEPATLERIRVITTPTKLVYDYGATLDLTGLQVAAYYSNNYVKDVTAGVVASPTELTTAGQVTITLSYTERETTVETSFYVQVADPPEPEPPTPEPPSKGCMGDIVTTSVVLSAIAFVGIAFIISAKIIRKKDK